VRSVVTIGHLMATWNSSLGRMRDRYRRAGALGSSAVWNLTWLRVMETKGMMIERFSAQLPCCHGNLEVQLGWLHSDS
jgi:hypothetical protein